MTRHLFTLVLFTILPGFVAAQDTTMPDRPPLRHEMTPEEYARRSEIGMTFVETPPPAGEIRNVAEFDRMQGALVRYPFGIPIALIKEMAKDVTVTTLVLNQSQKTSVLNQYVAAGVDTSHCNFLLAQTDTYWTRDYGPWFVSFHPDSIAIVDFPYNRPRLNDDEVPKKVAAMLNIPWFGMNLIHTGGNYMADGLGNASSTELVVEENPTLTMAQVEGKVRDYLGVTQYHIRPDPNGTYIDHIDCWGKFLAPDKILIRKVPPTHPQYQQIETAAAYWASTPSPYGYNYKVYRVNTPNDQPYTNSVIINNKVLVPFMNSSWDDSAKAVYEAAMPGYQVTGFIGNPSTPWESTDALHCRVMGIADVGLLYIKHIPISGIQPCETNYLVSATVIASSHQPVTGDSVLIHYRVNGGLYKVVHMVPGSNGQYSGFIPRQSAGSQVEYYLSAADASGRHETKPLVGAADPFRFTTSYTTLAPVPDTLWFHNGADAYFGKITQLHNFTGAALNLQTVEMNGIWPPWFVDSISAPVIPAMVNNDDSVAIRVKVDLPVFSSPGVQFVVDSLHFTTSTGDNHVIIMIDPSILSGVPDSESQTLIGTLYPNPFRDKLSIPLMMSHRDRLRLEILDIRGNLLTTLHDGDTGAGALTITWNGTGAAGNILKGGVYLLKVTSGGKTEVQKVVLIR